MSASPALAHLQCFSFWAEAAEQQNLLCNSRQVDCVCLQARCCHLLENGWHLVWPAACILIRMRSDMPYEGQKMICENIWNKCCQDVDKKVHAASAWRCIMSVWVGHVSIFLHSRMSFLTSFRHQQGCCEELWYSHEDGMHQASARTSTSAWIKPAGRNTNMEKVLRKARKSGMLPPCHEHRHTLCTVKV